MGYIINIHYIVAYYHALDASAGFIIFIFILQIVVWIKHQFYIIHI